MRKKKKGKRSSLFSVPRGFSEEWRKLFFEKRKSVVASFPVFLVSRSGEIASTTLSPNALERARDHRASRHGSDDDLFHMSDRFAPCLSPRSSSDLPRKRGAETPRRLVSRRILCFYERKKAFLPTRVRFFFDKFVSLPRGGADVYHVCFFRISGRSAVFFQFFTRFLGWIICGDRWQFLQPHSAIVYCTPRPRLHFIIYLIVLTPRMVFFPFFPFLQSSK